MLIVLIAGAALGLIVWRVAGGTRHPVTKVQIEREVSKRPRGGHVRLTLCNQEVVPSQQTGSHPPQLWTCDTYIGSTIEDQQNGPSYEVQVRDGKIRSIRQVPVR
jgi:hypothetical protein